MRGSEAIRTRVVQAGVLDVVAQVLEVWLKSKGMSIEAGSSGTRAATGVLKRKPAVTAMNIFGERGNGLSISRNDTNPPASSSTVGALPARHQTTLLDDALMVTSESDLTSQPLHFNGQPSALAAPVPFYGASTSTHPPIASSSQTVPSSSTSFQSATFIFLPSSFPNSGDENSDLNEGESSGTPPNDPTSEGQADGENVMMEVETAFQLAVSDEETARLAELASATLQNLSGGRPFREPIGPGVIELERTPVGLAIPLFRRNPVVVDVESPTPRVMQDSLPGPSHSGLSLGTTHTVLSSADSSRIPSPMHSLSNSTTTSAESSPNIPSATNGVFVDRPASPTPSTVDNALLSRVRPPLVNQHSDVSSAGASNVSTPMGTPTGTRDRSGTLMGRPVIVPRRRNRRERAATPGNESGTTGGEEEEVGDEGADEDEDAGGGGIARTAGGGEGGGGEVEIVEEEDGATDIESGLGGEGMLDQNVDLQMGAPPGAPGAVTPRTAADMTPRQPFQPMADTQTDGVNTGLGVTPLAHPTQNVGHGGGLPNPPGASPTGSPVRNAMGTFRNMPGMTAPAVVALATAQATQRTLRDLSMETGPSSLNENCYRDDDVLLSLQLLAYLSKYPHVRQAFHRPREPFHANLSLKLSPGEPALPMRPPLSATPNIFSLVERFTFKPSATDPTTPVLPEEIVYWAGVIMRNACRKDESRGGIRQCANMSCGKWESSPRQFAKCRRCRKAKYCSKECQSKAWSEGHRFWCS